MTSLNVHAWVMLRNIWGWMHAGCSASVFCVFIWTHGRCYARVFCVFIWTHAGCYASVFCAVTGAHAGCYASVFCVFCASQVCKDQVCWHACKAAWQRTEQLESMRLVTVQPISSNVNLDLRMNTLHRFKEKAWRALKTFQTCGEMTIHSSTKITFLLYPQCTSTKLWKKCMVLIKKLIKWTWILWCQQVRIFCWNLQCFYTFHSSLTYLSVSLHTTGPSLLFVGCWSFVVCLLVCLFVCLLVGWLVGRLVGPSVVVVYFACFVAFMSISVLGFRVTPSPSSACCFPGGSLLRIAFTLSSFHK